MDKITRIINKVKETCIQLYKKAKESVAKTFNKIKDNVKPAWNKCKPYITLPLLAIIAFVILFVLDLFALKYWTDTGIVIACILLVIETVLAVLLSNTNYGILGSVALAELVVGILAKQFVAALLSLVVYFLALVVIHLMHTHGGKKA